MICGRSNVRELIIKPGRKAALLPPDPWLPLKCARAQINKVRWADRVVGSRHDGVDPSDPVIEISNNRLKYFWIKGQGHSLMTERESDLCNRLRRQNEQKQFCCEWKFLISYPQQILNYWAKWKALQQIIVIFKFHNLLAPGDKKSSKLYTVNSVHDTTLIHDTQPTKCTNLFLSYLYYSITLTLLQGTIIRESYWSNTA
jgi:hypothetical protein